MAADQLFINLQVRDAPVAGGRANNVIKGVHQLGACAIIQGQGKHHAGILSGGVACPSHALLYLLRQLLLAPDILQPDVVFLQPGQLLFQIAS